jgi:hypothetical protein
MITSQNKVKNTKFLLDPSIDNFKSEKFEDLSYLMITLLSTRNMMIYVSWVVDEVEVGSS